MSISTIQDGFHVIHIVLDFLGEQLGSAKQIAAQVLAQQAGNDDELHPAVQVIVGNCLEPVAVDQIPGEGKGPPVPVCRGCNLILKMELLI